ncbi:MAG: hypothetical protein KGH64_01890 [Candidatus Micrarchaeota archaeon]|nr:hypothetical protein [Candidatus Micrarchaeota archaeon]MDE1834067.1 hypothetical protein [Candidatus Micrarchaeota archaeon]MDE1859667.1 hypothetical protein [Candidatus Micrarchaeota archaeon]
MVGFTSAQPSKFQEVKELARGASGHYHVPVKDEVRKLWYGIIDPSINDDKRKVRLDSLRAMYRDFVIYIENSDETLFHKMAQQGWKSQPEDMALLLQHSVDKTTDTEVDKVFKNIRGSVNIAVNMVSGFPYAAFLTAYLERGGITVEVMFLSYSRRESVVFEDGSLMEQKAYIMEKDRLKSKAAEPVIIADDMARTGSSLDSLGDALKSIGLKRIYRTTPADIAGDTPLEVWDGKVIVQVWDKTDEMWHRRRVDSELLRDENGIFLTEKRYVDTLRS